MNGDLSLSQSLGGLRIANPDDDVSSPISPVSLTQSTRVPEGRLSLDQPPPPQHAAQGAAPGAVANAAAVHHGSTGSSVAQYTRPQPIQRKPVGSEGVDVRALGFDPTSYSVSSQQFPPPPTSPSPPSPGAQQGRTRRLSHRQSMPIAHEASQQPFYYPHGPSRTYNPPLPRPSSGFYNHANMSSSSGPTPESMYQRVRAESTQSANSAVLRSNSRAGAGGAVPSSAPSRGGVHFPPFRQSSHSGVVATATNPPPRRTSKPSVDPQDGSYGRSRGVSNGNEATHLTSSEEWKDRGAALGMQKTVDAQGQTVIKPVKKGVKDFIFGRTLGEGSYSTVIAATDRQTGREYAIKVLDKRHIIKEKKVKYVNIEKDTLNRLTDHPGVVRLYYTFQDERSLYFVLDLATGGELLGVLKKMTSFDEECSRFYGAQILDAIEYMHQRGVIHRDLKPENVLLDDQMHVKITDFGTAKILDLGPKSQFGTVSVNNDPLDGADTDRAVSFVGTAEYVSPELLTDKNACKASDLWAFGCIIYQLLAGRPPFKAANEYLTFQKIVNLEYAFPEGFPPLAKDLVQRLLVLNPGERLPTDQIKSHAFFEGIQWGKGLWKQKSPRLRPYVPGVKDAGGLDRPRDANATPPQAAGKAGFSASAPSNATSQRPQPRVVTDVAPPSQLDIDWSPVLTKNNERILKLGQLVVYSTPAPYSPTSRNGPSADAADTPSKFSRLFGASATKKRQRLVMITSSARLVLAPSGGDKKEAKLIINLTDPEVSWRSQQDGKGYTLWSVFTRDKHLTFEDPKANTGDPGSSTRSTQEWLDCINKAKDQHASLRLAGTYAGDGFNPLSPSLSNPHAAGDAGAGGGQDSAPGHHRRMLRKEPNTGDDESQRGLRRFSKRHSKNGLAAVF